MTQAQARQLARQLTETGPDIWVAVPVPLGCWGGTERGWDVGVWKGQRSAEQPDCRHGYCPLRHCIICAKHEGQR